MTSIKHDPATAMKAVIEDLYRMEMEDELRVHETRAVTFNFTADDASMFAAIAKRFGKSTAAFGGEVFGDYVRLLFIALGSEDRHKLAAEADADVAKYLQGKGITVERSGYSQWAGYAALCDKHEKEQGE